MSLEIHSEDTPAATAAYHKKMKMHVPVEAWRSSPDLSLGVPKCLAWRSPPDLSLGVQDQDGIQGYLKEQFHTTAAHAAEECGHLGFVDVLGADSRTELLYVQSALLARTFGFRNPCLWKPGSIEPDLREGEAVMLRFLPSGCDGPPMALLWPLLLAVLSAEGQSSVGPAELMLLLLFLRLLHLHWGAAAFRH